jgi:phage N-6-adenine-methyltransferase
MINKSLFSSKNQTWETPKEFFDNLNSVFNFTLDVCAVPETAKCKNYFTPEIDGLAQSWSGNICWMNPPYGREQVKWIEKAAKESLNGATVVCLIPARPDTKAWQNIIFPNANVVCFVKGRLKFGGSKDSAPFPSAVVVFGDELTVNQEDLLKSIGTLVTVS